LEKEVAELNQLKALYAPKKSGTNLQISIRIKSRFQNRIRTSKIHDLKILEFFSRRLHFFSFSFLISGSTSSFFFCTRFWLKRHLLCFIFGLLTRLLSMISAEAASDVAATIVTYSDLEKPDWLDTTVLKLDKAGSENYFTEIPADTFIDAAETASRK
jgi:hypothetical protein